MELWQVKLLKIIAHRPDPKWHPRVAAEFEADHQKCIAMGHDFDEDGTCMWCGDKKE